MNGIWSTRRVEVEDGTRIEIWDRLPEKRGWSHKVGRVHFHDGVLHMAKKDCEFIEVKRNPPLRVERYQRQLWRRLP